MSGPPRALALWLAATFVLTAPGSVLRAQDGAEVGWGPVGPQWKVFRQVGDSATPLAPTGSLELGNGQLLFVYDPSTGHSMRATVRLSPHRVATVEQFAALLPSPNLPWKHESSRFNGHPAFHSHYRIALLERHEWLLKDDQAGPQHWISAQLGCSFQPGDPRYSECEARRAQLVQVLETLRFAAAPAPGLTARIELPDGLKPGDVVSPSAVITDEDGRPPRGEVSLVWSIGGQQRNSVTWDGAALRIELQATADGQPLTASTVLPAYGATPPPGDRPARAPTGPVPGLSGIGDLPGPRNTTEGLIGTLAPAALGLLGALLSGLLNAPAAPPPPAPPSQPKPPRKTRKRGQGSGPGEDRESTGESGDEEDEDEGEREKSGDKAKDGKPDKEKQKPPTKAGRERRPSAPPKPPDPGDHIRSRLEQLRRTAERSGSKDLLAAIDKAIAQGFGKDGKLDPEAWKAAQKDLWAVRDRAWKNVQDPHSWMRDALGSTLGAGAKAAMMAGRAVGSMAHGVVVGGYHGVKAIGDGVLHPGTFLRGAGECVSQWADKNAVTEKKGFTEGLRDGRVGDALVYLGMGAVKAGIQTGGKAADFVKKEILPWEELSSLADSQASLEEKLWAVPAAAAKIAGLLTMRETPTARPATRWGGAIQDALDRHATRGLAQTAEAAAGKVSQLEAQAAALERAAAGPGSAGVKSILESTRKALEKARTAQQTAAAAREVELLGKQAMRGQPAFENFRQAQRALKDNPTLTRAIDDALIKNNGGGSLYDLRARELISQDTHTLMTARKLQLQEQALNNAAKRMIAQEAEALRQAGEAVPRRFDTFNATQGSRSRLSGSNVNADLDQTVLGLKNVSRDQAERIVQEECRKLGLTQSQLDVNVYTPRKGLMDARGAAPNAQATLENIGQTTGTSGHHQVHVGRDGRIHVGDHVSTPQGREGVLAGRRSMDPPPGMSQEQWLREGVWEGHQGAAVKIPESQWGAVRQTQLEGLHHAFERGDLNQMVKYSNRGRTVGMRMDEATARLIRTVAGQKDPALASRLLSAAGINSPADLMQRLGIPH